MSKNRKIPLYDLQISSKAINNAARTLKSGWLSPGKNVAEFEKAIAEMMNCRYAAAVSSATIGMELTLFALGAEPGLEIITSPFTMPATVEAILAAGCTPVFADIDPDTLTIDPQEVFRKISDHTMVIIPVDIAGHPAEYSTLDRICEEYKISMVSDSAHAIGSKYKNKPISKFTDASVISFHATKNLVCGEGGIVLSKHKKLIEVIKLLSRHGYGKEAYVRSKGKMPWNYDVISFGFKGNMSELHAAVGLGQLSLFDKEQKKRTQIARRCIDNLKDIQDIIELPDTNKDITHGWHLFIIRLHLSRLKISRDKFLQLLAQKGIEGGVHYKPIFELSYYKNVLGLKAQHFPNTAYAGKRVVSLPLYPSLKLTDVDYICDIIKNIIRANSN